MDPIALTIRHLHQMGRAQASELARTAWIVHVFHLLALRAHPPLHPLHPPLRRLCH